MRPVCACGVCPLCTGRGKTWRDKTAEEKQAVLDRRDSEKTRAADRARYRRNKEKRRAAMDAYMQTEAGKAAHNTAAREWARRNAAKRAAHVAVGNAIRDGKLVKGLCELAGDDCSGEVQAHHDDYSKPLEVRWLCVGHHGVEHHEEAA